MLFFFCNAVKYENNNDVGTKLELGLDSILDFELDFSKFSELE